MFDCFVWLFWFRIIQQNSNSALPNNILCTLVETMNIFVVILSFGTTKLGLMLVFFIALIALQLYMFKLYYVIVGCSTLESLTICVNKVIIGQNIFLSWQLWKWFLRIVCPSLGIGTLERAPDNSTHLTDAK